MLFTSSLNLLPLSSKFLNKSKLALAGENNTICPGFATFFATNTVFLNSSHIYIFMSFPCFSASSFTASNIFGAVSPINIKLSTFSNIGLAIGV